MYFLWHFLRYQWTKIRHYISENPIRLLVVVVKEYQEYNYKINHNYIFYLMKPIKAQKFCPPSPGPPFGRRGSRPEPQSGLPPLGQLWPHTGSLGHLLNRLTGILISPSMVPFHRISFLALHLLTLIFLASKKANKNIKIPKNVEVLFTLPFTLAVCLPLCYNSPQGAPPARIWPPPPPCPRTSAGRRAGGTSNYTNLFEQNII